MRKLVNTHTDQYAYSFKTPASSQSETDELRTPVHELRVDVIADMRCGGFNEEHFSHAAMGYSRVLPFRSSNTNCVMLSCLPQKNAWPLGILLGLGSTYVNVSGQDLSRDFSLRLAGADRMMREGIIPESLLGALLDPTMEGAIKGQVAYSLSTIAIYTSNASLALGGDSDLILSLNPAAYYTTDPEGGARFVITAYYAPSYQHYFEDSSRGGFNQNGGISFATSGARASVGAFVNLAQSTGADRIVGGYSEATIFSSGLSASYQVAPRTNVWSILTAAHSDYSGGGAGSDLFSGEFGANWAASERLSIGPSLRHTRAEADTTGVRSATGILFNAGFDATEKIILRASIGAEMVDHSRLHGSSDPSLTGDFSLEYRLNEMWSTSASIRYANIPAPRDAGFVVNDLSLNAAVSRTLLHGSLSVGAGYGISSYERVDPMAAFRGNDETLNLFGSYNRSLPWEGVSFFSSVNYAQSFSRDWKQWGVSTGFSISF